MGKWLRVCVCVNMANANVIILIFQEIKFFLFLFYICIQEQPEEWLSSERLNRNLALQWNTVHLQWFWQKRQLLYFSPLIACGVIIGNQINMFIPRKWSCPAVVVLNQLWYQQNSQRTLNTWLCASSSLSWRCCLPCLIFSLLSATTLFCLCAFYRF